MSEPEFEMYLSLMSKFLRLNAVQKNDIAEELRVHLEDRLAELMAQGKSREEAIRLALDEFGDAGALAWQFTLPHSLRRRRQIMRYSIGSFVALAGIFTLVSLTWPTRPDRPPAVQTAAAQVESNLGFALAAAEEANDPTAEERREIEKKLSSREFEYAFVEVQINEALQSLSQQTGLPIIYSLDDQGTFAETRINLETPKGTLSVRSALELILRHTHQELTYSIKDGVILISDSNEDYEVQVYDCRDLLAGVQVQGMMQGGMGMGGTGGGFFSVPAELAGAAISQVGGGAALGGQAKAAEHGGMGGSGVPNAAATSPGGAALIGVLQSATQPAQWINTDGEGGSMSEFDGVIVVRHHQAVHRKIEDVLAKLRKVKRAPQLAVQPRPEDVESLDIPPGKRLVTLNANWQLPVNSIRSGSRVDIIRLSDNREQEPEVIMSNVEILLPRITPGTMGGGFGAPTVWLVNAISIIVTPDEAIDLINTERLTPHPLKFVLRGDDAAEDDEPEGQEQAAQEREDDDGRDAAEEMEDRGDDSEEVERNRDAEDEKPANDETAASSGVSPRIRSIALDDEPITNTIRAGLPEAVRDQVSVLVEPLIIEIAGPRFYPLVGQAQLLHLHYRCKIDYSKVAPRERPQELQQLSSDMLIVHHDVDHLLSPPQWK